jgi:hypothetical protein
MLGSEAIMFFTEPDSPTAMLASLTATQAGQTTMPAGQTTAQDGQTATQTGKTARIQGAVAFRSRNRNMLRKPIGDYSQDPSQKVDKGIRRIAFKFTLINDELYHHTTEDLLLKFLDQDQAKIVMGEVHEGICGTHQSAPKMKWLLRRAGFYWPTMIANCFRYYKGCEECQKIW